MRHILSLRRPMSSGMTSLTGTLLFAIATALAANIRFYIPASPVPITMQTFVVLLGGLLLGSSMGALSQILYIAMGSTLLSLFSVQTPGIAGLMGPTGGYLAGFAIAAFFAGKLRTEHTVLRQFILLAIINFTCIYTPGMMQLSLFTGISSPGMLLKMGFLPYIAGDLMKIAMAVITANTINRLKY